MIAAGSFYSIERTLSRGSGHILWHLKDGPVRFYDLARIIGGASKKMTTERLRHLEAQALVAREVQNTTPVMVLYEITALGRTAIGFLDDPRKWSKTLPPAASPDRCRRLRGPFLFRSRCPWGCGVAVRRPAT